MDAAAPETAEQQSHCESGETTTMAPVSAAAKRPVAGREQHSVPPILQKDPSPLQNAESRTSEWPGRPPDTNSYDISIPHVPAALPPSPSTRELQTSAPEPPPHTHYGPFNIRRATSQQSYAHTVGSSESWSTAEAWLKVEGIRDSEEQEEQSISDFSHGNGADNPWDDDNHVSDGAFDVPETGSQANESNYGQDAMDGCEPLHYFHKRPEPKSNPEEERKEVGQEKGKNSDSGQQNEADSNGQLDRNDNTTESGSAPDRSRATARIQASIGNFPSLVNQPEKFDQYANEMNKTSDLGLRFEFAVFLIDSVGGMAPEELDDGRTSGKPGKNAEATRLRLSNLARSILHRLADNKGYAAAQYFLADAYVSGTFGKPDFNRASGLFAAAGKRGHADASYRAGLCYEFGWGCRTSGSKAEKFYCVAASEGHPGAMLRMAKMSLSAHGKRDKEGINWLIRATDSASLQFNQGPYELGLLYEKGLRDELLQDEIYTGQLFTKAAALRHAESAYRMGDAYEHGKLSCPHDPALSIHFYTTAALCGHPLAMMALCAWYMIGADPMLERDESEAYEWAKRASEAGM